MFLSVGAAISFNHSHRHSTIERKLHRGGKGRKVTVIVNYVMPGEELILKEKCC